jgi:tetratricopeptide (TPR) repeat protein
MGLLTGLKSLFSARGRCLASYERGLGKAKRDDFEGAIEDYTAALAMANIPVDVRAMVLFNRGLAYSAIRDEDKAKVDLQAVIQLTGAPSAVVTAAREKIERMRRREKK